MYLIEDLKEAQITNSNQISYEQFKLWVYRNHNISINYSYKILTIAASLTFLDEIQFVDNISILNSNSNILNNTNNNNNNNIAMNNNNNNINFNSNVNVSNSNFNYPNFNK